MSKVICSPGCYIQGNGELKKLADYCAKAGANKAYLLIDKFIYDTYKDNIESSFKVKCLRYTMEIFGGECSEKEIRKHQNALGQSDIVIGIGGGKTLDTAKAISFYSNIPVIIVPNTSFRIGGPARRMAFPERGEQLVLLLDMAARCGARPLVMGNGTNLLAPDEGLDRLVIDTSAGLSRVEAGGTPGTILAEAGASLARVADFACRQGLAGLEFAHGIPGTVGGAVCMNAGAYGGEMAQVVREATLLLPEEGIRTLTGAEMAFGYRRSFLTDHPDAVVLRAEFCLTPGDPAAIRGRMKELLEKRRASQPLEFPSAGSTFKRPEGYYAGTLIDQCGLKGLTVGGAQVSEKHAGFVINRGGATCADVKELIRQIQERVFAQAGVRLEPEVRIID